MSTRAYGSSSKGSRAGANDRRFRWLAVLYILGSLAVVARLWQLQVRDHDRYTALASGQQGSLQPLYPERGQIYAVERDGNGGEREVPLAVNREAYLVFANTREISDPKQTADALNPLLQMKPDELLTDLSKPNDAYSPIKHRVPAETADAVRTLKLPGIYLQSEEERFYPNNNIGSHVAGFVQYNNGQMSGQYGLEGYFDKTLAGTSGQETSEHGASGIWMALSDRQLAPAKDGDNLVLTVDWTIEYKVCQALDDWVKKHGATGGSVIVMDPSTGAIQAMCGSPDFNPNIYNEVSNITQFNNPAIFQQYEPGSVFKTITLSAALEEGKITPTTTYTDTGQVKIGPYTIRNADNKAHGVQTMTYVLDQSLNTGAIFAERQIGQDTFLKYVEQYGFGEPTGVELSGEASGDISNLKVNNDIYPATASFGQGISATPLQIAAAYGAIANGGKLVQPYIVQKIVHPDGSEDDHTPHDVRKVISEKTAALTTGMLVDVVENGEGKKAAVPGYYIAGKTGTAQIPRSDGKGYEAGVTIGTFAGFAPVHNPKFVMVVRIDRPRDVQFAESSAAPLFGQLAKFMLQYNEIPPERALP